MKGIDVVKDFEKRVWGCKDLSAIKEYCIDTTIIQSPVLFADAKGLSGMKEMVMHMLQAFPDLSFKWDDHVSSNNRVVSNWRAAGTNLGHLLTVPATGKVAEFTGLTLYVVVAGKIRHYQCHADISAALTQLEIL